MKTLVILAWKNIWRHPARSGALLAAAVSGLWAGVLTIGIMNGIHELRMDYLIRNELAHVQVHHPEFLSMGYARHAILEHERIMAWMEKDPRIDSAAPRTLAEGMLHSPVKASGVRIRGIAVDSESRLTNFHDNMVEGQYLSSDGQFPVIMGASLADMHNTQIGERVVLVFDDADYMLTAAAFHVVGLFHSPSKTYDNHTVFVRSRDLAELLAGQPVYHEIAALLYDRNDAQTVTADLAARFPEIDASTWYELSPVLRTLLDIGGFASFFITMVIMLALAFGILNTMLMAIFERIHEIGMLLSIGMARARVFLMVLMESIILTLTGAVAGIILAWISIWHFSRTGINLEMFGRGAQEIGWSKIMPVLDSSGYGMIFLIVVVISISASVYPAIKATRVNPVQAVRERE